MESLKAPSLLFRALFLYPLAEHQAGHISRIDVTIQNDEITVSDNGRGHAMERTVDGVPYLQMVYEQLYAPFETSRMPKVLIHTIGMSILNSFCAYLELEINRKGAQIYHRYENGRLVDSGENRCAPDKTGNTIKFRLSDRKLREPIDIEEISQYLASVSAIHESLQVSFNGQLI